MAQKPVARTQYSIGCTCGTMVTLDARSFGRPQVCVKCKGTFTVVWGKDPRTDRPGPIAVAVAKKRAKGDAPPHGMMWLACSCGYRRPAPPAEASQNQKCPGCGKWMFVDPGSGRVRKSSKTRVPTKTVRTASASDPAAAPRPRKLVHVELKPGAKITDCPCGQRFYLREESFGKELPCTVCDRVLVVHIAEAPRPDPTPRPRPAEEAQAAAAPATRSGVVASQTPPSGTPGMKCVCGELVNVPGASPGTAFICTGCGRELTMKKYRDPQSMTTILRPFLVDPSAPPRPKPAPAPETADATVDFMEFTPEAGGSEEGGAPLAQDQGQSAICQCGEELIISAGDVGRVVQCPTCSILMSVEQSGDGALRVRAMGKVDQGNWSLDEFK